MKLFRCYNTQLTEIEGWETKDKHGSVEITDEDNGFIFHIKFGKKPKIEVFSNSTQEEIGPRIFKKKIC